MHEETFSLCGFLETEDSRTKLQEYNHSYWSKNSSKINEAKRRKRQMKKDQELNGNVSTMFESAARPGKVEQQNVDTFGESHDKASVANCGSEASAFTQAELLKQFAEMRKEMENRDRQRDERQKNLEDAVAKILNFPGNQELIKQSEQRILDAQMKQIMDLRDEVKELKKSLEPATQPISSLNTDQQVVDQMMAADQNTIENTVNNSKLTFLHIGLAIFCMLLTALFGWFVVIQTVPLYESLKFPMADLASCGALALAIALSGFATLTKSKTAKAFMAVMLCYEFLLVVAGTDVNQGDLSEEALRANPAYSLAEKTLGITKRDYEQKETRYEDQNSKMFQNDWYKRTVLDPAYDKYSAAAETLAKVRSDFESSQPSSLLHLVMKVLFRILAIVVTVMCAQQAMQHVMKLSKPYLAS